MGDKARILSEPMAGLDGKSINHQDKNRFIVEWMLLKSGLMIEIECDELEKVQGQYIDLTVYFRSNTGVTDVAKA